MSDREVVFMDPPPLQVGRHSTKGKSAALVAPLRERPNEWARVRHGLNNKAAGAYAAMIRKGRAEGIEEGEFDVVSRKNDTGTYDVFARFIPEADR